MSQNAPLVVVTAKSAGVAILLTLLFGPLGMLYSTVLGALIMMIVTAIVGFLTYGIGLIFTWPICMIWAAVAAGSHNRRAMRRAAA